jgi:hypothetical protein
MRAYYNENNFIITQACFPVLVYLPRKDRGGSVEYASNNKVPKDSEKVMSRT